MEGPGKSVLGVPEGWKLFCRSGCSDITGIERRLDEGVDTELKFPGWCISTWGDWNVPAGWKSDEIGLKEDVLC